MFNYSKPDTNQLPLYLASDQTVEAFEKELAIKGSLLLKMPLEYQGEEVWIEVEDPEFLAKCVFRTHPEPSEREMAEKALYDLYGDYFS